MTPPLKFLRSLILHALREDIGSGDLTTRALIPRQATVQARIVAQTSGIIAGTEVAAQVFSMMDRRIRCAIRRRDGQEVRKGQVIMTVRGPARSLLAAERTALNFFGHLSGIATFTRQFVDRVRPYRVRILDTRKTLPGLRVLEKYAVRMGGGTNHRMRLDDAVLIKTNHLRAVQHGKFGILRPTVNGGGRRNSEFGILLHDVIAKVRRIRPKKFIEIEVTNLHEFKGALQAKPDAILLDNWRLADIRKAVLLRNSAFPARPRTLRGAGGRIPRLPHETRGGQAHSALPLEVSGGVTLRNVRQLAKTGVERISIGALTHSAPSLDVSLQVMRP